MKKIFLLIPMVLLSFILISAGKNSTVPEKRPASTIGITHYGMPIEEIKKTYRKDDSVLEIIYSKTLSDDNMDDYIKRYYDELLNMIQNFLYANKFPHQNMKIIISNCKFCKIGYCKDKNIKEVNLTFYVDDKKVKSLSFKHIDIIDKKKYQEIARSTVTNFFED
jgi:hypothetical protein